MQTLLERSWHSPAHVGRKRLNLYKLGALLLAGTVNAIAWVLIVMAGCYAFGTTASPYFLLGVGLAIPPLSVAGLAVLTASQ